MNTSAILSRAALGTAAGVAGTAALQRARALQKKIAPDSLPKMRAEPGEFMVREAESMLPPEHRNTIPDAIETGASRLLAVGYGASFGLLYGVITRGRHNPLLAGTALGVAAWAVGYLGWLPATRIMQPVTRQKPLQVAAAVATHIYFGVVTATSYSRLRALRKRPRWRTILHDALS